MAFFWWSLVPVGLLLLPMLVVIGWIWHWKRGLKRVGRRNPLTSNLLRSPGESLRSRIADLDIDIALLMALFPVPGLLAYTLYLSYWVFEAQKPSVVLIGGYVLSGLVGFVWMAKRFRGLVLQRRQTTLGYEAELAVGQELSNLGDLGFRAFHDFPAEAFNVDHVLIGPSGVYALETKGRSKPGAAEDGEKTWEVTYDGAALQFPGWRDSKSLDQARRQAQWLSRWLSSATGEDVAVQPVLVLPGWFIRRTSPNGMPVLTGKQIRTYFEKSSGSKRLSAEQVQRIVHQVDARCRDVAPKAYKFSDD